MSKDRASRRSRFDIYLRALLISLIVVVVVGEEQKGFYIVFLGTPLRSEELAVQGHIDILSTVKGSDEEAREALVHSYTKNFDAFAAKLSEDEAQELSNMEEVVSVIPNRYRKLHTTRSWDFIGLTNTARRNMKLERDIVVGMLDSGISPKGKSFKDDGFGPPPKKWKGTCGPFANFTCNNKIIGARYFKLDGNVDPSDVASPLDVDGHGTHTSSTAAGVHVANASLHGLAKGVARGAVPTARLAMYKVCWEGSGCADMDLLAAFDAAIEDGVDVISISIGGPAPSYKDDAIAIGAFHAVKNGITVIASAGNEGPDLGTVSNHAPWIMTVAASGIDRQFRSKVVLGNGWTTSGIGISTFDIQQKLYPLVNGADVPQKSKTRDQARLCFEDSLDPAKVKGKLVFCEFGRRGADSVVKGIGGIGTIIESSSYLDMASIYMAPATQVNVSTGEAVVRYINSTRSPSAQIHNSEAVKIQAPIIASFSSRGPNPGSKRLLKPDIAAPGIDILAAFTPLKTLTGLEGDTQYAEYTLMSGTSMACPHVAGVAAYVKSFHPDWSPAAISSAILTSAKPMSKRMHRYIEFSYGAGQVQPRRAISPGLVYDMDIMAHTRFLCREGYTESFIQGVLLKSKTAVNCSKLLVGASYDGLNYPTIKVDIASDITPSTGVFRRSVTNVGPAKSVYNATVRVPPEMEVTVTPKTLSFTSVGQTLSFEVTVKAQPKHGVYSGDLLWRSSRYIVRSPIVISNPWIDKRETLVEEK